MTQGSTAAPSAAKSTRAPRKAPAKTSTKALAKTSAKNAPSTAHSKPRANAARKATATTPAAKARPHGREEVIESIIDATLSLWTAKGTAELSMRSIAARADVNYGLVHRHFGTKEAVIRAAMDRVVVRSMQFVKDSADLTEALDSVLPRSTGAHARLLAWTILQYRLDDVMPEEDPFLTRLRELAAADVSPDNPDGANLANVRAGSLLAMLYGWRLFEPYLVRGLGLDNLSHEKLDGYIRENIVRMMAD